MANFIRAANPIWSFVDPQTGLPLNDEYFAFFLTNDLPYLPQIIARDNQGFTVWPGSIIELTAGGALPQNLFFEDDLVYRIQIRHGNTMNDLLVYDIPDFLPTGESIDPDENAQIVTGNQSINPQFLMVNFQSTTDNPYIITEAATYSLAPGWDLVLTGSGSTTLQQLVFDGQDNIINNPAFGIQIANTGWTSAVLKQRFSGNGALWANEAVAVSLTGLGNVVPQPITITYVPNSPGAPALITTGVLGTGQYTVVSGAIPLPDSVNTTPSTDAYVEIQITLPPTGSVNLTNIFVFGETLPLPVPIVEETNEQQINSLFSYYYNSLVMQPKDSILTGWTFAQNPWQFTSPQGVTPIPNICQYTADQTILYQETAAAVTVGMASAAQGHGLAVKSQTGKPVNRFALIQYIDPVTVKPYWNGLVSALVKVAIYTSNNSKIRLKVKLLNRTSLPPTLSTTEPIASWPTNADPIFAAGWNVISCQNDPAFIIQTPRTPEPHVSYNKFLLPPASGDLDTLAIVVYTMDDMVTTGSPDGDGIVFDSISLCPNEFAIEANPLTFDEALRRCEYYYEKSYGLYVQPGTVTALGQIITPANIPNIGASPESLVLKSFNLAFKSVKRGAANASFFSPVSGVQGNISMSVNRGGTLPSGTPSNPVDILASDWTYTNISQSNATMIANVSTVATSIAGGSDFDEGLQSFHYTLNALLGA